MGRKGEFAGDAIHGAAGGPKAVGDGASLAAEKPTFTGMTASMYVDLLSRNTGRR
jgi:hypothetical protein